MAFAEPLPRRAMCGELSEPVAALFWVLTRLRELDWVEREDGMLCVGVEVGIEVGVWRVWRGKGVWGGVGVCG